MSADDPADKTRRPKKADPLVETEDMPPPRSNSPGFLDRPPRIDPWTEVTPHEIAHKKSGDESTSPEVESYKQDEGTVHAPSYSPRPRLASDLSFNFGFDSNPMVATLDAEWQDAGADGPVAAPLDAPAPLDQRFQDVFRDDSPKRLAPKRSVSELQRIGYGPAQFTALVQIERRTAKEKKEERALVPRRPSGLGRAQGSGRSQGQAEPTHGRRYPKMRALLQNPERVPHGSEGPKRPHAPPVPGTFFPAPRKERDPPQGSAAPADLDQMLAAMAEGLLVGDDGQGGTEVRVTLRDEFFAGTELRIQTSGGKVRAVLVPPDRSTYLELNGNIDELRARLEARGLNVEELRVAEP